MKNVVFFLLFALNILVSHAAVLPPGFVEIPIATGLDPTAIAQSPDGRIWIAEKNGTVRIVENGQLLQDPFVFVDADNLNERGLSGIAIDPNFEQNGYVYLYYTVKFASINRLSRFKAVGNFALPGSEEILINFDYLSNSIHNGGSMVFGHDGKLYIATGDSHDGPKSASMESLHGKVLRFNADGSIPDDNPFFNTNTGIYRSIYATGLRNPFSMAIQPGTGRIFSGDVGGDLHEEINDIQAGKFYGWNMLEGKRTTQNLPAGYQDPLYSYPHNLGCAVVGGAFYNPAQPVFPAQYQGKFFFTDYCFNYIKVLDPATGQVTQTFATEIDRPLCLLTGNDGALYYISRGGLGGGSLEDNTSSNEGMLWRIDYVGDGAPVFSINPASNIYSTGENATFTAKANGSQPITYQWQRDSVDIPGATAQTLMIPAVTVADSGAHIRCLALNTFGQVTSNQVTLRVTSNLRPDVSILTPLADFLYSAGDTIFFSGSATDPESGLLPPDNLTWRIDLHHDVHTHPGLSPTPGIDNGFFVLPVVGETDPNVWLRIHLSATDQAGLTRHVQRDLFPYKTTVRIHTEPPGLPVRLDGKNLDSPAEAQSVRGLRHQAEVGRSYWQNKTLFAFQGWKDAAGQTIQTNGLLHTLFADDDLTERTAQYTNYPAGDGTGLYARYVALKPDGNFGANYLTRIDTVVNFDWAQGSPDPQVPADNYGVRWQGALEAPVSGEYTLVLNTDDGCRLWINDSLLIDAWEPKAASEEIGVVYLVAGVRYPLVIEYFEMGGGASAQLLWSSDVVGKSVIPKSQLYPYLPEYQNGIKTKLTARIQPNPVTGNTLGLYLDANQQEDLQIRLVDAQGRLLHNWVNVPLQLPKTILELPVGDLALGQYWLEVSGKSAERKVIAFVKM